MKMMLNMVMMMMTMMINLMLAGTENIIKHVKDVIEEFVWIWPRYMCMLSLLEQGMYSAYRSSNSYDRLASWFLNI